MNAHVPDPGFDAWVARARDADILVIAQALGANLKKTGTHEWSGACIAGCASTDGFVVDTKKQIFVCRPSGKGGHVIALAAHALGCDLSEKLRGKDFIRACEAINGSPPPDRARRESPADVEKAEKVNAKRKADAVRRDRYKEITEAEEKERAAEIMAEIRASMRPIAGTHAGAYLTEGRGIPLDPGLDKDLHFVEALEFWGYPDDRAEKMRLLAELPAMVAMIRDAAGQVIGIHRTYLDPDKPAAWAPPANGRNNAKKMLGESVGGMIRFGRIGETLAVAEGVETARSFKELSRAGHLGDLLDFSLAAAGSLFNLSGGCTGSVNHPTKTNPRTGRPYSIPNGEPDPTKPGIILPAGVKTLIIVGDADSDKAMTRARVLTAARRAKRNGVEPLIWFPPDGMDANDLWQRLRAKGDQAA